MPENPELTVSRQILEGQDTWEDRPFVCKGQVGNPQGHIEIESDFTGTFSWFLDLFPRENDTEHGIAITQNYTVATKMSGNCGYEQTIEFGLKNVSLAFMGFKHLRCVTKPSPKLLAGKYKYSKETIVKVVPGKS